VPAQGIGIAIKVEDGGGRAAEVTMAALLLRYAGLDEEQRMRLQGLVAPPLYNVSGRQVGEITAVPGF
jgi:L-asparaginase II